MPVLDRPLSHLFTDSFPVGDLSLATTPLAHNGRDRQRTGGFDPAKIETGGEFESIASGLALIGREADLDLWSERRAPER